MFQTSGYSIDYSDIYTTCTTNINSPVLWTPTYLFVRAHNIYQLNLRPNTVSPYVFTFWDQPPQNELLIEGQCYAIISSSNITNTHELYIMIRVVICLLKTSVDPVHVHSFSLFVRQCMRLFISIISRTALSYDRVGSFLRQLPCQVISKLKTNPLRIICSLTHSRPAILALE
jgi:hypothetical protein